MVLEVVLLLLLVSQGKFAITVKVVDLLARTTMEPFLTVARIA
jgi:hypothetical protein